MLQFVNALLIFTYDSVISVTRRTSSISKGVLAAILVGAIASAVSITATLTFLVTRRHARSQQSMSRRRLCELSYTTTYDLFLQDLQY